MRNAPDFVLWIWRAASSFCTARVIAVADCFTHSPSPSRSTPSGSDAATMSSTSVSGRSGVVHNVIVAITIPLIPRCARVVRSSALSIREVPYIDAARLRLWP